MRGDIDHDAITLFDERDRTTVDSFRRDMTDAEPVRATREPSIGDQRGIGTAARALHRTRDRQHLAHARPTLRAFVADHDHIAGFDAIGKDRFHRRFLTVEDARATFEVGEVDASHLHHCTLRGERTGEHRDATDRRGSDR